MSEIAQNTGMSRRAMMTAAFAGGAVALALPAFAEDALAANAASAGRYPPPTGPTRASSSSSASPCSLKSVIQARSLGIGE